MGNLASNPTSTAVPRALDIKLLKVGGKKCRCSQFINVNPFQLKEKTCRNHLQHSGSVHLEGDVKPIGDCQPVASFGTWNTSDTRVLALILRIL